MIRFLALAGFLALGACSSSQFSSDNAVTSAATQATPGVLFARGPIARACLASGRDAASSARCGCVQAVANRSLSASDQRRGVKFFDDPHSAQETRQSDNPTSEAFWLRWKAFGDQAGRLCR